MVFSHDDEKHKKKQSFHLRHDDNMRHTDGSTDTTARVNEENM